MVVPTTPPPLWLDEIPITPIPTSPSTITLSPTASSPTTHLSTVTSPPASPSQPELSYPKTRPRPPQRRIQPSRIARTKSQSLPQPNTSRLINLPIEIHLMILRHLRCSSLVSVLALRCAHPFFISTDPSRQSRIKWNRIPRRVRKGEYAIAEKCIAEGCLRGLFSTGKMPCYNCLLLKGKSCFSRDVREGHLAIGDEGFEQRTCESCGGSDKEMAKKYLKGIFSIWGPYL